MSLLESAPLEWYILESVTTESSPLEERAMQLGPFATEAECRSMLDDIQRMPKFNRSPLAVHKRIRRRDKRIKVELQVYVRRSGTDEKSRYMRGCFKIRGAPCRLH
jgi:hypothetical protein